MKVIELYNFINEQLKVDFDLSLSYSSARPRELANSYLALRYWPKKYYKNSSIANLKLRFKDTIGYQFSQHRCDIAVNKLSAVLVQVESKYDDPRGHFRDFTFQYRCQQ